MCFVDGGGQCDLCGTMDNNPADDLEHQLMASVCNTLESVKPAVFIPSQLVHSYLKRSSLTM